MFALTVATADGGFQPVDKSEGYLEINLYQDTLSVQGAQISHDYQKTEVHKCNQDDRRNFYYESD